MAAEYRCANCGRVGPHSEAVNWRGWMLCRVPCDPLDNYPDELKAGLSPQPNQRCSPHVSTERSGADGGGSARAPTGGALHSCRLGPTRAPGLSPAFWRGLAFALLFSLPCWALIALLAVWILR